MLSTVYTWIRPDQAEAFLARSPEYFEPVTRPAVRVWGDELLELWCERTGCVADPPLALRRRAGFGWPDTQVPRGLERSHDGRLRCRVDVDATLCAVADLRLLNPVFTEQGWRACVIDLVERGIREDLVREELAFLEAPTSAMRTERAAEAVRSTGSAVLDEVLGHFAETFAGYVGSWRRLDRRVMNHDAFDFDEVVFPPKAITSIEVGSV